ncbi:MAG: CIA30 family protein [Gammaproteobacteria bacterium]
MHLTRRRLLVAAGVLPLAGYFRAAAGKEDQPVNDNPGALLLSDFSGTEAKVLAGAGWRGFSDRVMGGVSDASLDQTTIDGRNCMRLTGTVTRESNGGFIQMAMYFGSNEAELDGSAYKGIEILVYGNNEDYNVHVRTADCGWYDESYRYTFFAKPEWQRVRMAWDDFKANGVKVPLNSGRINRIAILGWMREFQADIALARISLYT